jgi:hypothetical protein
MFGVEKLDERYQPLILIGGIVLTLSLFLFGLFVLTTFVQPEFQKKINPTGQTAKYYEGLILVGTKPGISKSEAQSLFSNLGLGFRPPITKEDGTFEYAVDVPKGQELAWISKFKKQSNKIAYAKLIEARIGEEL